MLVSLKNVLDEAAKIVFNKSTFISRHHFNIFWNRMWTPLCCMLECSSCLRRKHLSSCLEFELSLSFFHRIPLLFKRMTDKPHYVDRYLTDFFFFPKNELIPRKTTDSIYASDKILVSEETFEFWKTYLQMWFDNLQIFRDQWWD